MTIGQSTLGTTRLGARQRHPRIPLFGANLVGHQTFASSSVRKPGLLLAADSQGFIRYVPVVDLQPTSPLLQLYELIAASGAARRACSYADPEASATLGQVTYDGDEYVSVPIDRPALEENIDGRIPSASLAVHDPDRSLMQFVRDNNKLAGAVLKLHIIQEKDLSDPTKAISRTFRVRNVTGLEGPARIQINFGAPPLSELSFPTIEYARLGCSNRYPDRFTHDGLNYCNYPSDEFGNSTKQRFDNTVDTEVEGLHGWFVINNTYTPSLYTAVVDNSPVLTFGYFIGQSAPAVSDWDGTTKTGPFVYKKIVDAPSAAEPSDADIDVYAEVVIGDLAIRRYGGILIQSIDDSDDWIFFGSRRNGSSTLEHIVRVTVNGVTTETVTAAADASVEATLYRIKRVGSDWTLYRSTDGSDPTNITWTTHSTESLTISGDIRVGAAYHNGGVAGMNTGHVNLSYFRFLAGGYRDCDRTSRSCVLRNNEIHRNAAEGLPDEIVF